MTREEAINEIKSWDFLEGKEIEAIQTLIPELRESEDERIRKEIIDFIQWAEDRGMTRHDYHQAKRPAVWIAYLEKQKETANSFTDGVIEVRSFQRGIAEGRRLERQKEPGIKWLKSDNVKNPDKPYVDKAGMFYTTDGRMCYASEIEQQKEQKPVEYLSKDKVYAIMSKLTKLSTSNLIPFNSPEYKKINEITSDIRSLLDYPIEQKPVKRSMEDDHIIGFVYDLLNEIEWKDSWAMSKDECLRLLSNYIPEKSAEWSEEDKRILNDVIEHLKVAWCGCSWLPETLIWLKSLRPSWKPSEAQLMALHSVIDDESDTIGNEQLKLLYEQLKKLL